MEERDAERNTGPRRGRPTRVPLSRRRVVTEAVALADEKGEPGVTMRAVAGRLGVEAMSLYNHVANRGDLLDGMVDAVFAEIDLPDPASTWRTAVRDRTESARATLRRHPWAVGLMDSRSSPGPATLRHHDAVLGVLREGGFSIAGAVRAVSVIDSYLYGFVLQETSLPFADREGLDEVAGGILGALPAGSHPYLAEVITEQALGEDLTDGFAFGLTLILDALHPDQV
ncbi:TetR/AcrR family transcriptional regulator C-terminal domain-containing protein [Nocardiopsis sp. N85]|uniref:TetR/AcrR family transcriptional regulator n=1 Tax=Nocardiopsis sp. N85 TaxID=3029400 RepID=UPI00237EEE44|nr:TetR/AcrR family transcriptional regulator C-terminal domain-containing protein [Nocardiopsis sp. N85]MDE3725045.1 TetR/AcrR family transcriptional regulator C-terminal domain-containing protein [Nocardiopsis sp. N85]